MNLLKPYIYDPSPGVPSYEKTQHDARYAAVWALHVCALTAEEVEVLIASLGTYLPRVFTREHVVTDDTDWGETPTPSHPQHLVLYVNTGSWNSQNGPRHRRAAETHVLKTALKAIGREPVFDWTTAGDWSARAAG